MTVDAFAWRRVGRTDLRVTQLGFGTATLGDIRVRVSEAQSSATIEAAWSAGVGYFDTAPWYGRTKSEHRLGAVLRGRPRESYVLSTKVGRVFFRPPGARDPAPEGWAGALPFELRFDYTRAGVLRSYEDRLQRLRIPGGGAQSGPSTRCLPTPSTPATTARAACAAAWTSSTPAAASRRWPSSRSA